MNNVYKYNDSVVFIECVIKEKGQPFCIYVEPSYKVVVDVGTGLIKLITIQKQKLPNIDGENIIEYPTTVELSSQGWNDLNVGISKDELITEKDRMGQYDITIDPDENRDVDKILLDSIRQMQRYKLCVRSLPYKLFMMVNDIILSVGWSGLQKIQYWRIIPFEKNLQKLMIMVSIDNIYNKPDKVVKDLLILEKGIFDNLQYNQNKQVQNIHSLINHNKQIFTYWNNILNKRSKYQSYLQQIQSLMESVSVSKHNVNTKINQIKERRSKNKSIGRGWNQDVEEINELGYLNSKLSRVIHTERELQDNYITIWRDYQNVMLESDRLLFDSSVILVNMINNFNQLKKISV